VQRSFPAQDYNLAATLSSGQAFRWSSEDSGWTGVIGPRWVSLLQTEGGIRATVAQPVSDWSWLRDYLQLDCCLDEVVGTFPADEPMRLAVNACRGLRLLRQDIWECLACFILSSTKQIVQIRQIVGRLCERHGWRVAGPAGGPAAFAFPSAATIAEVSERELRLLGMGFRAPYLSGTARMIAAGAVNLEALRGRNLDDARAELMRLPGVGRKIADCVLLFAAGQAAAFPVDVWILKTVRGLYFEGREVPLREVEAFARTYFGPCAGYAQQYLFHSARLRAGRVAS